MINYIGPESLKNIVENAWKSVPKGPRGEKENPKIRVGLSQHGIDYKSIGFPNEKKYFKEIDSLVNQINDGNINVYDKLLKIGNGNVVLFEELMAKILSRSDEALEMTKGVSLFNRGGYSPYKDEIYFDPEYVFSSKDFNKTFLHEITHWELGNTLLKKEKRKYYEDFGIKIERGGIIKKLLYMPRYASCIDNLKRIERTEKNLKINAIDEGIAFAASSEENPGFSSYYERSGIPTKDYEKAYETFREILKNKSYGESVEVARKVIDESYTKGEDALIVLERLTQST